MHLVSLRYFAPDPRLNGLISSYYLFQSDEPFVRDVLRAELAQTRFVLEGATRIVFPSGEIVDCPAAMIIGSTNSSVTFEGDGPCTVAGAGLLPAGWASLIGCSADDLADSVLPLDDVAGALAGRTLGRLQSGTSVASALDAMFLTLAERARSAPLWFTKAVDHWLIASPDPRIDDLITETGVSARQVERLAKRYYGASPKLLARKYRALQAAVRMGTGVAPDWSEAAGEHFYDQSHFIREFKQFVGMTPSKFLTDSAPVMRLTIAGRQALPGMPKLALYS